MPSLQSLPETAPSSFGAQALENPILSPQTLQPTPRTLNPKNEKTLRRTLAMLRACQGAALTGHSPAGGRNPG